jgi:NAD(P)-dependent dehydrogenase (short-subunit alcohol dehydrogenase family)
MPKPLFSGRVAVVTAAGQGAGREKARASTQHGARDHHGVSADPQTETVGPS